MTDLQADKSGPSGLLAGFLDQLGDTAGELRTLTLPVGDAVQVDAQALFLTTGHGVAEAQALDAAAVKRLAGIGNGEVL